MNIMQTAILLICLPSMATSMIHFQMIFDDTEKYRDIQDGPIIPEFYVCSRDSKCTHVVKHQSTGIFKIVHGLSALQSIFKPVVTWEKVFTPGMLAITDFYLSIYSQEI